MALGINGKGSSQGIQDGLEGQVKHLFLAKTILKVKKIK